MNNIILQYYNIFFNEYVILVTMKNNIAPHNVSLIAVFKLYFLKIAIFVKSKIPYTQKPSIKASNAGLFADIIK